MAAALLSLPRAPAQQCLHPSPALHIGMRKRSTQLNSGRKRAGVEQRKPQFKKRLPPSLWPQGIKDSGAGCPQ